MKREKSGALNWLDRASGKIKFPPDRKAVRRELQEHIEDKADDLQRLYPELNRGEAERMAMEQMGDADEVGRELASLHHPLLGWLWYGARAIMVLSVSFTLLFVMLQPNFMEWVRDDGWEVERLERRYEDPQKQEGWTAPEPVELEHYTLEVRNAARMEEHWQLEDTGGQVTCQTAAIQLRLTAHRFWQRPGPENWGLEHSLTAVDDHGREIGFQRIQVEDTWESLMLEDEQPFAPSKQGWNWQQYELLARDITPGAQWVELRGSLGGEEIAVRVDIPEKVTLTSGHGSQKGEVPWLKD